jgi:serine/threonine protein kinase/Flp pilus assembly protein TadD
VIGRTLLHYRVLARLGKGGMGEVFLAVDTKLQRRVALKMLPVDVADKPGRWERFEREVRAVAALNHPNIVTLYSVDEADGYRFFTMEVVEGDTLDRLIPHGGVGLPRFFELALPLIDALAAAHGKGITHRDLKPENVMVSRDGRLKVLDFGMAKPSAESELADDSGSLTEEGFVVGTARYMAPEQATGQAVDQRADIFALGIVLYELATGQYPFSGRSAAEVISSILRDMPPLPHSLVRILPPRLGAIIYRCLEKMPENRYQSADELKRELEALRPRVAEPVVELEHTWAEPRPAAQTPAPAVAATSSGSAVRAAKRPSLAILPLADLSGQPDYFADGLTEELITSMAKIGSLRVISRQSVMRYRTSTKLLPEIASELGVEHVLSGSVLRSGEDVRISLQLVRADPEQHLWADRFDRPLKDVLRLHSEVARAVAGEIEVKLSSQEVAHLAAGRSVPPEAVEAYLKGRYALNKRTTESLRSAPRLFEEAVALAPHHAAAHAGLAESLALLGQSAHDPGMVDRARTAAHRAIELDPNLADAHAALAFVSYFYDWDWKGAEESLQCALELAPNHAGAHYRYWGLLLATGRRKEAWREIRRALELDPLAPMVVINVGLQHHMCGDYPRAIRQLEEAAALEPGLPWPLLYAWRSHELAGDQEAAATALLTCLRLLGREDVAAPFAAALPQGYGAASLAAAESLVANGHAPVPLDAIAWLYLAGGDREAALRVTEQGFRERMPLVFWLGVAPDWDPLRSEPRFARLLHELGLPDASPSGERSAGAP